jgi:Fic family protein
MPWIWEHSDWPRFTWEERAIAPLENEFLVNWGKFHGTLLHVKDLEQNFLTVDIIADEAVETSRIEGEILDRDSVQSSIRSHFGLTDQPRRVRPAEEGVAALMTDLYENHDAAMNHELLFKWHLVLMDGRHKLRDIGRYRTSTQPMRVVSGPDFDLKIHYEAPPSRWVPREMDLFMEWYHNSRDLPALTRASLAHLYFVTIHPFEDGNGRIARALAEKALAEAFRQPTLLVLSRTINQARKAYYKALEQSQHTLDIHAWVEYFAKTVVQAQVNTQKLVTFVVAKTHYYDRFRGAFNPRQGKVVARMMREGYEGLKGGLSTENYLSITGTSRATATRDLKDLADMGALLRTGQLKGTRYHLPITDNGQT